MAEAFARTFRPAGDDDALALRLQGFHMLGGGMEDIGAFVSPLGRKIAADLAVTIDDGRLATLGWRKRRDAGDPMRRKLLRPFVGRQIKRIRRQRLIRRIRRIGIMRALARVVIVADLCQPLGRGVIGQRIEH